MEVMGRVKPQRGLSAAGSVTEFRTIPLHSTDSTYAPILGHSRSPILGRHPDQSYRLFRYTPQIQRTLRFSAILDRRSSAATNAHIFFRPEAPPRTPPHTHINIHLDR
ncbi:uncharacterized protein BDCG_16664 [Blastomyces dermatitidis ER-3]|uniref:Uncharacterized protein n=1 Tax=Ajellomyces dermatitidis (strain ER-3 / ATCC MYA-2586) TaxID=559297 RepID=A0ABX2VTM8_AJEDR|nr:uncharacterized protein BDCG_16664 [Blastomyces dermatitidis ER-3]OAT00544.1 hypothetical protein BDCG_16664 [Blastomyces dermatitidis ER-3]